MRRHALFMTLIGLPLALTAGGCSVFNEDEETISPTSEVEVLYDKAYGQLAERNYKEAVNSFEEVERQHPYSEWAQRAQVMAAYASYKAEEYDQATALLERYVKLHPSSASTPYAYYLIALCYYEQISDVGRDQKMTQRALAALQDVVRRFPDTEYARDAQLKLDLAYDHLAGKEMQIGRYYLQRDEHLAAINRFRHVVQHYQTTSHVPEALHRLTECYLKLGIADEAQLHAAVLGHNFPSSPWYRDSYRLLTGKGLTPTEETGFLSGLLPDF